MATVSALSPCSVQTSSADHAAGSSKRQNVIGKVKAKQSKSRNGCAACKAKRLKCDEVRPICQHCERRGVPCSYRRSFRWRQFDEVTYGTKPLTQEQSVGLGPATKLVPTGADQDSVQTPQLLLPSPSSLSNDLFGGDQSADCDVFADLPSSVFEVDSDVNDLVLGRQLPAATPVQAAVVAEEHCMDISCLGVFMSQDRLVLDDTSIEASGLEGKLAVGNGHPIPAQAHGSWWSKSEQSPQSPSYTQLPSDLSIYRPTPGPTSTEALVHKFHQHTCSILSLRSGVDGNPWKAIIWPLAHQSPALFHAIGSMSAFHGATNNPQLKAEGIQHMRESIGHLARDINHMPADIALATVLALAFAESWDTWFISNGVHHVKAARTLVSKALTANGENNMKTPESQKIKFLCNSWIYVDVIAHLTSNIDDSDTTLWSLAEEGTPNSEVDPLMGCASTLFPIIGRVAALVNTLKKTGRTSINGIAQASELKHALEAWLPPAFLRCPDDSERVVLCALRTAEAYRWAALLYLHQAYPDVPSLTVKQYARKALTELAVVPASSRTTIVHIFPLFVAGCEAESMDDRMFVEDRWKSLSSRLQISNVTRCYDITREIWLRRDRCAARPPDVVELFTTLAEGSPVGSIGSQSSLTNSSGPGSSGHLDIDSLAVVPELFETGAFDMSDMTTVGARARHQSSPFRDAALVKDTIQSGGIGAFCDDEHPTGSETTRDAIKRGSAGTASGNKTTGATFVWDRSVSEPGQDLDYQCDAVENIARERRIGGRLHWTGVVADWNIELFLG